MPSATTATRLAAYAGVLALVFGLAWVIGGAASPAPTPAGRTTPAHGGAHGAHGGAEGAGGGHEHGGGGGGDGGGTALGGLTVTESGYTFDLTRTAFTAGAPDELAFRVTGSDGRAVTAFDVEHEKRMHLVVVRRDATGFQHLHPELGPDGVWRTPLTLPAAGVYRAFADFTPTGGPALTLGADLFVAGDFRPAAPPGPVRTATVDGYEVTLEGELTAGGATQLVLTVRRDGAPVTDLQPYLGAFGHLVVLRTGDLAYLHVHPDAAAVPHPEDRAGPQIAFTAEAPSEGSYRLFLDFRHGDTLRTAEFSLTAPESPTAG